MSVSTSSCTVISLSCKYTLKCHCQVAFLQMNYFSESVCVREREKERKREGEGERERERGKRTNTQNIFKIAMHLQMSEYFCNLVKRTDRRAIVKENVLYRNKITI